MAEKNAVLYEVSDGIATVTLNRPDRLNAIEASIGLGIVKALDRAATDGEVRVVILTGAGRGFCAGGDFKAIAGSGSAGSIETELADARESMRTAALLREMPKVTIAAVNGPCAGAGMAWACASDLRYAADSAVFNTAFLPVGQTGDYGGTWTLSNIVGPARARELYLLSERIDAERALEFGLVSAVYPDDRLLAEVRAKAQRIVGFAPLAVAAVKANLNDSQRLGFNEMLEVEMQRLFDNRLTEDVSEAMAAYLERRAPVYRGR